MRIAHLAAGAGGMYCGSCMHDNRLAATLIGQGREVVLIPLYTPLRTDEIDVSEGRVYYGGINTYLQQVSAFFRHTPAVFDWLFDWPTLLRGVGKLASRTRPEDLGEMTLSVMRGEDGRQRKELEKLIDGLRTIKPDLIHLPNLLFIGWWGGSRRNWMCRWCAVWSARIFFWIGFPSRTRSRCSRLFASGRGCGRLFRVE